MSLTALALLMATSAATPGTGTLWLDGEAHEMEVTMCDRDTNTAGARGALAGGDAISVMIQRWPGLHALSVVHDNAQWVHRGPEDSAEAPDLRDWTGDGQLAASGTVAVFPPIRDATMEVRFEGQCPV
ncbi:hypothetical protein X907_1081 [Glycocaulis alkaliphilus]|uniref:Uncharacterized protein n=1 Tax=Glycocaulis alkaliphilus TaxID=1434191 RepID=A0A3T0E8H7_9PROT|nr:hypothetical protein [Glycocaulis alkaliphilus]AZU03619.1 hypothetical protein X907_1081 [Glycocaulis alkaliphilus]GGB82626.1 hypothetical protein GCM10007417_23220 [Glycocaulis alkaliphilus]